MVQDKSIGGSFVERVPAGDVKERWRPDTFENKEGNLINVTVGDKIPEGAKIPTTRNVELTEQNRIQLEQDLAGIEQMLTSGIDSKGNKIKDLEALSGWADAYNKRSTDNQMILVPAVPGKDIPFEPFGLTIPGTSKDAEYIKVPRTGTVKVLSPDGKSGSIPAEQAEDAIKAGYQVVR